MSSDNLLPISSKPPSRPYHSQLSLLELCRMILRAESWCEGETTLASRRHFKFARAAMTFKCAGFPFPYHTLSTSSKSSSSSSSSSNSTPSSRFVLLYFSLCTACSVCLLVAFKQCQSRRSCQTTRIHFTSLMIFSLQS